MRYGTKARQMSLLSELLSYSLQADPKFEILRTHARTNWHLSNTFHSGLGPYKCCELLWISTGTYPAVHHDGYGMGATAFNFKASTDFSLLTNTCMDLHWDLPHSTSPWFIGAVH